MTIIKKNDDKRPRSIAGEHERELGAYSIYYYIIVL